MMFYWIYDLPTWTLVFMVCGFFVGATWIGTIFVRPFLRVFLRKQPGLNDLVGYLLGAHGVYFGILLGLLALSSYENFSSTEKIVTEEATKISTLYRDVSAYPQPAQDELKGALRDYTRFLIDEAWPDQKKGILNTKGAIFINRIKDTLVTFEPKTKGQEILHAEAYRQFNVMGEARSQRLYSVTTGIPAILWWVVFIGAGVNVVLLLMLDVKLIPHMILSGVISFYLATLIALIAAMDNPFRGEVSVSSDPYQLVYDTQMKADLAPLPKLSPTNSPTQPSE